MPVFSERDESLERFTNELRHVDLDWQPTFGQTVDAAFRIDNTINSIAMDFSTGGSGEAGFDPFNHMEGWEQYAPSLASARSIYELEEIKRNIMEREKARIILHQASGLQVIGAELIAGVTDPINIIGAGSIIAKTVGRTVAKNLLRGAKTGVLTVGTSEIILSSLQDERTLLESLFATAASGGLGGVALAGIGLGRHVVRLKRARLREFEAGLEREFSDPDFVEPRTPDVKRHAPGLGDEIPQPGGTRSGGTEARPPSVSTDNRLAESKGAAAVARVTSPALRVLSSTSKTARTVVEGLVETGAYLKKNFAKGATEHSVESLAKTWRYALAESITGITRLHTAYRLRLKGEAIKGRGQVQGLRNIAADTIGDMLNVPRLHLSITEFRIEVTRALRAGGRPEIPFVPEIAEAAAKVRKVLDDASQQAVDVRLLKPEDLDPNYVPRIWDPLIVTQRRNELVDIIHKWQRENLGEDALSKQEIHKQVQGIIQTPHGIEGHAISGPKGIFRPRQIKVADDLIEDFLDNDIDSVLRAYTRAASVDIELTRKFGSVDMKQQIEDINSRATGRMEKASPEEREAIANELKANLRDIEAMRDILRGVYGVPDDPYSLSSRAARIALEFNNLTMLGGAAISSIPDIGRIIMVNGMENAMPMLRAMVTDWKTYRIAARESQLAGTALDMVLQTRVLAMVGSGDLPRRYTKFERGLGQLTNAFFIANLLSPWNAFIKQAAGVATGHRILGAVIGTDVKIRNVLSPNQGSGKRWDQISASDLVSNLERDFGKMSRADRANVKDIIKRARAELKEESSFGPNFPDLPEGYEIRIGRNKTREGRGYIAAAHNRKGKIITLDEDYIKGPMFKDKAWTTPKVEGVTPLPADAFKTPQEWFDFIKMHEMTHVNNTRLQGETLGAYENRINKIALTELERPSSSTGSIVEGLATDLDAIIGKTRTISNADSAKLLSAGIDEKMGRRIAAQFEKHGDTVNGLRMPNTQDWTDDVARRTYRAALVRDVDTQIITPGAGDQPLFAHRVWGRLLTQYKSFVFTSASRVMVPGMQIRDRAALHGMMMMIFFGGTISTLKSKMRGQEGPDSVREFLIDGIDQSGILSYLTSINNGIEALSDNQVGVRSLAGVAPPFGSSTRWKIGQVGGPTASQAARISSVIGDLTTGDVDFRTRRDAWRMVPGNNLPIFRLHNLFQLREGLDDMATRP